MNRSTFRQQIELTAAGFTERKMFTRQPFGKSFLRNKIRTVQGQLGFWQVGALEFQFVFCYNGGEEKHESTITDKQRRSHWQGCLSSSEILDQAMV